MKLSIIIITYNRASQLREAIESCLKCVMPSETEILVIDNNSSDCTKEIIEQLKATSHVPIVYFRMDNNLGVGEGRNFGVKQSLGEYIYVLDDDAVISDKNNHFFLDAIEIFEKNPTIATLTTQIYDTAWKANRLSFYDKHFDKDLFYCFMPCGGSHFLKRSYFSTPLYFPNKYGYEEIPTAMQAYNSNRYNIFTDKLLVIHKPKHNKWIIKDNQAHFMNDIASQYVIKKCVYPRLVIPLLRAFYHIRYFKHLRNSGLKKVGNDYIKQYSKFNNHFRKISLRTFFKLLRTFGTSIL